MRINLESVVFRYGRRTVLDRVDWTIGSGVTGLLGPNGSGKTTLLNLLAGMTRPNSGSISFSNLNGSGEHSGARRMGFLPQQFSFAPEMTVHATVAYSAWVNGRNRAELAHLADEAVKLVGLTDKQGDRVRSLSGGQRQRLGLATALAHEPDFLILDEPTMGLDPGQRLRIREVVANIGQRWPVILSTHLVEDITHLCERVAVLAGGRVAFDGTVDGLTDRVDAVETSDGLGSPFERAYTQLIKDLEINDD